MDFLNSLLRAITPTKALEASSGKMETAFFETVYRVTYIAGKYHDAIAKNKGRIIFKLYRHLSTAYHNVMWWSWQERVCASALLQNKSEGLSSLDDSFLYKLYSTMVKLMIALFMMSEIWYMLGMLSSLDTVIEQLSVILIQVITLFRYKYMQLHQDNYKDLATSMQKSNLDVSTPGRKALVEFWSKKNETYLKLMVGLGSLTLAVWYVYPLVDDLEYNLTVAVRLPVDYKTPSRYPIAYLVTLIAFHYTAFFIMVNDVIMQAHLIHLICQYTVLADCFENILVDCKKEFSGLTSDDLVHDNQFREAYIFRLHLLVEQHKTILKHTMQLRKMISAPMLGQVASSGLQICFAGFQVALTLSVNFAKFFMSLLFLGYNLFELFVICRWCDEIKIQSENIGDALYCSGWECGLAKNPGVRSRLLLVFTRASKPLVLTAGGISDLSLFSYANLVKTSYSTLTVLLRLRH